MLSIFDTGDSSFRLANQRDEDVGWIRASAIGFDGFATEPEALAAAVAGSEALAGYIERLTGSARESRPGGRVRLRRQCGPAWLSAGYQRMEYSASALVGGAQRFVRESIDAAVDVTFGDVDVSLTGETWFGDQEDAFAVTLFVQYRF